MEPGSLIDLISTFPRERLAHTPTPFEPLDRLSEAMAGPRLFVKRDDQTGLAFGGNKARKLEFIMADALAQGAGSVITWAGVQSNWCRQTAAACCRLGIRPVLILFQRPGAPSGADGNLLLDHILEADVRVVEAGSDLKMMRLAGISELVEEVVEEERRAGREPYIAPIGGSLVEGSMTQPWGAVAYAGAFAEMFEQAQALGIEIDAVVMATGSGSTQAGLIAGARALSPRTRIVGITVSETEDEMTDLVQPILEQTLSLLELDAAGVTDDIIILDRFLGEGYGILNEAVTGAIRLVASTEGLLLDPVYTGKAMAGLIELAREGYFNPDENVVFLHSGGTPALFPYRDGLLFQSFGRVRARNGG
jgi:D-cysteine desulfhydrase family pyridoxal phosphate-dependent enzyme